jgi:NAD(P)-dependent dehydrogenase (short-subunit alcohol dehydrogenase family)
MSALDGKTIVLTGAGAGIGRAVATRFVHEGARVVAVDIAAEGVEGLRDELGSAIEPIVADVRSWEGNVAAVDRAVSHYGGIDVFVGNAGITDGARPLEDIDGTDLPEAFQELFGVNVLASLLGVRAAAKQLIAARGAVILTASYASFHAAGGGVLYTASKHAVLGLVRQLAYEYAPDVRVNGVAPGVAPTRLKGVEALGQQAGDSVLEGTHSALPLQEIPSTDSYGGVFTLLASASESRAMTGTVITADSGLGIRGVARPGGRVPNAGDAP